MAVLRLFALLSCVLTVVVVATAVAAAPAGAPSRAGVRARATALGFGRYAGAIARDALPGARLVAGGSATLGGSRLGGRPDLPRGTAWPQCRGRPLSFLAQLRLRDVAEVAPGAVPSGGDVLTVFADLRSDPDGITHVEEAYGRVGDATCVVVRAVRGALTRRATPSGVATLRSRPVGLQPTLTVADYGTAGVRYHLGTSMKALNAWFRLEDEAAAGTLGHKPRYAPIHQVFGWPSPVQDAPLYGCGGGGGSAVQPTYRLLLQLDFDEPLRFAVGDGGALYLSGKPADLRAGRFGRLCAEFQEG